MQNPFENPAFEMASMTAAINVIPNAYGRVEQIGLMPAEGINTRTVIIEEYQGVLNLLPTMPLGAPGTTGKTGKRRVRSFTVPHIPHDDVILPQEYQGIRAFGSATEMETLAAIMARKLQTMRAKHDITLEHLRMGALKGVILDADGSTLFDLYSEFGITQKTVNFALNNANTEVLLKCYEVSRHVEDNLKGEVMSGVYCLCSQEFFDALTTHKAVKEAYGRWLDGQALRTDMRRNFPFGGIVFEEYRGVATDAAGASRRFIADGEARFFPLGTGTAFRTYFAPADFVETTNTLGLSLYAKQKLRDFERGVDVHTQSNPLPLCLRPAVLVQGLKQ